MGDDPLSNTPRDMPYMRGRPRATRKVRITDEPLFITCEGSGGDLNPGGTCKMCHAWYPGRLTAPEHDRPDILAMLERGDYDAQPDLLAMIAEDGSYG